MSDRFTLETFADSAFAAPSLLICSGSFEQRCLSIPMAVRPESVEEVAVLRNIENDSHVTPAATTLMSRFGGKAKMVDVFGSDPIKTSDGLQAMVETILEVKHGQTLIDISAMMRETLLILLALLRSKGADFHRIVFAYNAARYNRSSTLR